MSNMSCDYICHNVRYASEDSTQGSLLYEDWLAYHEIIPL